MKWNDMAFWKKLSIAFGTLLALLVASAGISIVGIGNTRQQCLHTQYVNGIHDLFSQKTLDHYHWLSSVDKVLLDGKSTRLGVQTDDHQCKLGAWLYGSARKQTEAAIPAIAALLKNLEAPHARMHDSAKQMDRVLADRSGDDSAAVTEKALKIYRTQTLASLDQLGQGMQQIAELLEKETATAVAALDRQTRSTVTRVIMVALVALAAGILFSLFMTRYITTRVGKLSAFCGQLADGDFTGRIDIDQKDELGMLADSLKKTRLDLSHMFGATIDEVVSLASSSDSLFAVSTQLSEGAEDMTGRSNTVAAAAEEMSSNMNSVAAASEQAATNVNMVATAAEEMTTTVKDIAGNSDKGRTITNEAVTKAESASLKVNELGAAAEEISKVTEVITEISEQTNLLALNATIEAARAGEAGKGFAVVANEIKELARQTAEATQGIKAKVTGIQNTTADTVSEIGQISEVIRSVNDIVTSIANAVAEQSITTQEIAENVAQASQGIQEVNVNVAQSSSVAAEIARDIAQVSRVSEAINDASNRVSSDAGNLSSASTRIKEMMQRFKIDTSTLEEAHTAVEATDVPDLIHWDDSIRLDIKVVDKQHKRLVELINGLNRAMKRRKGREALTQIFAELVDYTKRHFGDEEHLMRKYGYDGLGEQEAEHKHFVSKMAEIQQQVTTGNAMVTMDLMEFLKGWLVKHIKGSDKQYQPHLKSKGVA